MKALLALLFGISIIAISICLHVRKTIDRKSLTIMFGLAIVGGLAIANYDVLKRLKWLGMEIETARNEIQEVKTDVLIAKQATQSAKSATEELGKILTRIAYFQVITKGQFGTAQAKKAIQRINGDLNRIVNMMIPDPKERSDFVNGLINELK